MENLLDEALKHLTEDDKTAVVDEVFEMIPEFIAQVKTADDNPPCRCAIFDILQRFSTEEIKTFMKIAAAFGANMMDDTPSGLVPPEFRAHFEQMQKQARIEFSIWAAKYSHCQYELERRELEFEAKV